jgi:APA family basic amino acid/polyamine antiporter
MNLNLSDKFLGVSVLEIVSITVLLILTAIHSFSNRVSAVFQNISSTLKIIILLLLIVIGLVSYKSTNTSFELDGFFIDNIWNKAFAFSLFFVTYSYSGWNAASYITGEVRNPERNVPIALIIGTGSVSLLYVLLNFVFLKNIPLIQMENKIEIGTIFTTYILGSFWGKIFGGIISFLLVSSISSMVIAGPRVTNAVANDFSKLSWFSKLSPQGLPLKALWVQAIIAIAFILTSSFESMITMIGFVLNLFTMLTVIGAIKVGNKLKGERKLINKWVFPLFPLIFLLFQVWILIFGLYSRPIESCIGLLITLIGIPIYSWVKK